MNSIVKYVGASVLAVGGGVLAVKGARKISDAFDNLSLTAILPDSSKANVYEQGVDSISDGVKGMGMAAVGSIMIGTGVAFAFLSGTEYVQENLPVCDNSSETLVTIVAENLSQAQDILDKMRGDKES